MNEKLKNRQNARKAGCAFMNEREKGDFISLENRTVTLKDAYKLKNDDGEYWAFTIAEDDELFYFANASLGLILNDAEELAAEENTTVSQQISGVRVSIGAKQTGKKGRQFRPVEIVD